MTSDSYTVLAPEVQIVTELTRRKSRFLTVLCRVESQQASLDLVHGLRREHHGARHHCSAWVIGHDRREQRAHDDGEPSGTAGAPMFEALTRTDMPQGTPDLSDVCVVVIRWFGGTLLGAGGLVSAYSDSVVAALAQARAQRALRQRQRMRILSVPAPIGEVGRWEYEFRSADITVRGTDYMSSEGSAELHVMVPDHQAPIDHVSSLAAVLNGGAAEVRTLGHEWVDLNHVA